MATYKYLDENGRPQTIAGVLDPVALTGVSTTSGSNVLTCASTTGVYPFMPVSAPNFPVGVFVGAVKSATELELWLSTFNRTTGVWTTTAANANATASGSSLLARAHGYSPACIIEQAFALGTWRNLFRTTDRTIATSGAGGTYTGPGVATIPDYTFTNAGTSTWAMYPDADTITVSSDEFKATPVKRHNGELWGCRPLVSTGGHLSHVPAHPKCAVFYSAA